MNDNLTEQLSQLPALLTQHLTLSASALVVGILISIPLAIFMSRNRLLESVVIGLAGMIQTIPSLALLGLMVPLLGMIGFWPAFVSLVLYSGLPILRNTLVGIKSIDNSVRQSALAIGMTDSQILFRVELPLAAPIIVSGIRTAAIWVVGIATLATPVGQPTLGNFIFVGLQTQNQIAVLTGCIASALLALLLDASIRIIEKTAFESTRMRKGLVPTLLALAAILGITAIFRMQVNSTSENSIVVGGKTFTEQYILANLLELQLNNEGVSVIKRSGLGSQIAFDALRKEQIDCYVEYTGTLWTNILKRRDFPSPDTIYATLKQELLLNHQIEIIGRLGFSNNYAIAIPKSLSEKLNVRTLSELANHSKGLRFGVDIEFAGRPESPMLRQNYGFGFAETRTMDSTLLYNAVEQGTLDAVIVFTSDGRIDPAKLSVLEDDRHILPSYDAVILCSSRIPTKTKESLSLLQGKVTLEKMQQANRMVDVHRSSPGESAQALFESL